MFNLPGIGRGGGRDFPLHGQFLDGLEIIHFRMVSQDGDISQGTR